MPDLPSLARYARVAARQVTHATLPLQELAVRWAAEAKTFEEDNPARHAYADAWAQRAGTFALMVMSQ